MLAPPKGTFAAALLTLGLAQLSLGCAPMAEATAPSSPSLDEKKEDPLAVARGYLKAGRYADAAQLLSDIETDGSGDALHAEALLAQGKWDEAAVALEKSEPKTLPARLQILTQKGALLVMRGQRAEAEAPLMEVILAFNSGAIDALGGADKKLSLRLVGEAADLLRSPKDANEAFNQAEELGDPTVDLLLSRGRLFFKQNDLAHAREVADEALVLDPTHPDLLIFSAEVHLAQALDFDEAERLIKKALLANPVHARAQYVLAGIELRDMRLKEADAHIEKGLGTNPKDLDLLALRATVRFLAEDPDGFEQQIDALLALSPGYARAFEVVAEFAEWEHRYEDIERLMRRAVRLDREDPAVRAILGLTLVRSGSDAAGVVELRQAFELDPFNVRVKNTLSLYENSIPKNYVESRVGPMSYRFPKDEAPLLSRYIPQLLDEAHKTMVSRYGFSPRPPIGIELYASTQEFAVRTSGLPRTAIAGVCFGRKLATVSPYGAPGNLGMTLWHELAHVFHIGLSESRVPRWFTEGMAEWETEHLDRGWSRELDLQLYGALRDDRLPSLGSMGRAFTRAERMEDIAVAYYASGRIVRFIVETRGEAVAVKFLAELGKKRLPVDVLPEVLGKSADAADQEFRAYLKKDLARFSSQFVSSMTRQPLDELEARHAQDPSDAGVQLSLAQALLQTGKLGRAAELLQPLVGDTPSPEVALSLARVWLAQGDKRAATQLIVRTLAGGSDGFELRMFVGRLLVGARDYDQAREHLKKAAGQDPFSPEPWMLLASVEHELKNTAGELEAVRHWAQRDEHEVGVHQRLVEMLIEAELYPEAAKASDNAIWAGLGHGRTHQLAAEAFDKNGDLKRAEYEWESALLGVGRPGDRQKIVAAWSGALESRGLEARAKQVRARHTEAPAVEPPSASSPSPR